MRAFSRSQGSGKDELIYQSAPPECRTWLSILPAGQMLCCLRRQNRPRSEPTCPPYGQLVEFFGFKVPIVVDEEGVIIVGHTRNKAAQKLGLDKVPVHVAKGLTPAQVKAYRLADNKTGELAEWDYNLLPIELADLQGMDFDLDLIGFDVDELAKLLGTGVAEGLTDPDDVPTSGPVRSTQFHEIGYFSARPANSMGK